MNNNNERIADAIVERVRTRFRQKWEFEQVGLDRATVVLLATKRRRGDQQGAT